MATFARGYWQTKCDNHNLAIQTDLRRNEVSTTSTRVTWTTNAGDELTLRGIPAIGRGIAGAIRGTSP
jgi:hypothetical protein